MSGTRILTGVLAALVLIIQYPLWLGRGGWMRVWDLGRQVDTRKTENTKLELRNKTLDAEVRDLKQGLDAIEERARYELGMVKPDEIFFQILPGPTGNPSAKP